MFKLIGITIILLIIIVKFLIKETKQSTSSVLDKDNNINFHINSFNALREILVKEYYNLMPEIKIITTFHISPEQIKEILINNKIFIFNNNFEIQTKSFNNANTEINIKYTYSQGYKIFRSILNTDLINKLNNEDTLVLDKIKEIFNNLIKSEMTDFEKELTIHDFLIKSSKYDYENYLNNSIPESSYTPYGLLFNHIAVCAAYAEVFMIFMTLSNIECHFVVGKTLDSRGNTFSNSSIYSGHAWNIVKIDGKYYHVDVTFDNPNRNNIGMVNHTYFNVTDEFMDYTHKWKLNEYPICLSTDFNFFNGNKI